MKTKQTIQLIFCLLLLSSIGSASEAKKLIVQKVKILGETATHPQIILRYSPFCENCTYSEDDLNNLSNLFERALKRTLFFEKVRVWFRVDANLATIMVYVEDAQFPYLISGGAIFASIAQLNALGDGNESKIVLGKNALGWSRLVNWGKRKNWQLNTQLKWYQQPDFTFLAPDLHGVNGNYEQYNLELGVNYIKGPKVVYQWRMGIDRHVFYGFNSNNHIQLRGNGNYWFYSRVALHWDSRDHVFFPEVGTYLSIEISVASRVNMLSYNFKKLKLDLRKYIPVFKRSVLFLRSFNGVVIGNYPYQSLFQLDNLNGIRSPQGNGLHGRVMMMGTVEWRQKLFTIRSFFNMRIIAGGFIDGGWIHTKADHLQLKNPELVSGPLFRIQIPYPIYVTLNFAYGINKKGNHLFFGVMHNL